MIKVSIIIITKDNYSDLVFTLESIINFSKISNVEILIIDSSTNIDQSTICDIQSEFLFSKHIIERRKGISRAFNSGIEYANGDWIFFLNSGDRLQNPNVFEQMLNNIPEHINICYGISEVYDHKIDKLIAIQGEKIVNWPPVKMPFNHQSVLYRKVIFYKYGLYNLNFKIAMDYEHLLRCNLNEFLFKPIIISRFYIGGTSSNKNAVYDEWCKALLLYGFPKYKAIFYKNYYKFRLLIKKYILKQ